VRAATAVDKGRRLLVVNCKSTPQAVIGTEAEWGVKAQPVMVSDDR